MEAEFLVATFAGTHPESYMLRVRDWLRVIMYDILPIIYGDGRCDLSSCMADFKVRGYGTR